MPTYEYEAVGLSGVTARGVIDAETPEAAELALRESAWCLLWIRPLKVAADSIDELMDPVVDDRFRMLWFQRQWPSANPTIPWFEQWRRRVRRKGRRPSRFDRPFRSTRDGDRMLMYLDGVLHSKANLLDALRAYGTIDNGRRMQEISERMTCDAADGTPFTDLVEQNEALFGSVATEYLVTGTIAQSARDCLRQYLRLRADERELRATQRGRILDLPTRRFAIGIANAMELTGNVPWSIRVATLELRASLRRRILQFSDDSISNGQLGGRSFPMRGWWGLRPGLSPKFCAGFEAGCWFSDIAGQMRTLARL